LECPYFQGQGIQVLYANGYLKEGSKIGRSTATYYLRQLGIMVLVHPKKGIYKDGHERADTVAYRKIYTSVLNELKHRERTYTGQYLQIEVPLQMATQREAIRVYHDECIYASHEGRYSYGSIMVRMGNTKSHGVKS
jgi:hypothetical protein